MVEYVKLPTFRGEQQPLVQLATVVGRQVCVRNMTQKSDPDCQFLNFTSFVERITALTSRAMPACSFLAVAAIDYEIPD